MYTCNIIESLFCVNFLLEQSALLTFYLSRVHRLAWVTRNSFIRCTRTSCWVMTSHSAASSLFLMVTLATKMWHSRPSQTALVTCDSSPLVSGKQSHSCFNFANKYLLPLLLHLWLVCFTSFTSRKFTLNIYYTLLFCQWWRHVFLHFI